MPFKSKAQRRKFAELLVSGEISPETYEEWNRETGRKELPERVNRAKARSTGKRKTSGRKTAAKMTGRRKAGRKNPGSKKTVRKKAASARGRPSRKA